MRLIKIEALSRFRTLTRQYKNKLIFTQIKRPALQTGLSLIIFLPF